MESSDSSDEELKLLQPKKRLKLDITRCIICQEVNCNKLRSSTEAGLESFDEALKVRQDAVSQTIKNSLGDHDLKSLKIVWHGNCFQSFWKKRNVMLTVQEQDQGRSKLTGPFVCFARKSSVKEPGN